MSFATIPGSAPLRAVVAGAGKLGPYWASELVASPDCELVGWVDLERRARARRGRPARARLGAHRATRSRSMLERERPDFLVNVTAPAAHRDVTIAALEAGAAVLSEKPMAATLPEAVEMIAAADRTQRLFAVSQNRRYLPSLQAFRETVAGLGPLSSISCDFYRAHRIAAEFLFAFDQPLLLDMAIHLFDGARAITGTSPLSVYCESYNPPWIWYAGPGGRARRVRDERRRPLRVRRQLGGGRLRDLVDGRLARRRRARAPRRGTARAPRASSPGPASG